MMASIECHQETLIINLCHASRQANWNEIHSEECQFWTFGKVEENFKAIPKSISCTFFSRIFITFLICHMLTFYKYIIYSYVKRNAMWKIILHYAHQYTIYILYNSIFMTHLKLLWRSKYNVPDILSNDIDALVSRINVIQKNGIFFYVYSFEF